MPFAASPSANYGRCKENFEPKKFRDVIGISSMFVDMVTIEVSLPFTFTNIRVHTS